MKLDPKTIKKFVLILAIISFFLFLMTSFSFPDLFAMFYVPNKITEGNIYSFVKNYKAICQWVSATWPPLYYYTIGFYIKFLQFFGVLPNTMFSTSTCPVFELLLNPVFLFWAKLPFLLLHFATGWIFSQFFEKKRFLWFLLWVLNPVAIFINFIEGQFDSIPTFFFVLGMYYAIIKKNPYLVALAFGIGAAYKHYPFLLLIPFALILCKNMKQKVLFFILSLLPYLLTIIPSFNKDYLQSLMFNENYKMLESGVMIGDIKVSFYVVLYVLLLFKLITERQKNTDTLIRYSFLFSIAYFITSFWFVQRLLFLIPSLLLLAVRNQSIMRLIPIFYWGYFVYILIAFAGLFDHTLLRPLFPSLQSIQYDNFLFPQVKQLVVSVFTAYFIWLGLLTLKKSDENESVKVISSKMIVTHILALFAYLLILFFLAFLHL